MRQILTISPVKDEAGASAVEFALVAPVLVVALMGIIEFGLVLYTQSTVQSAARDVTRQLSVNKITAAEAPGRIRDLANPWLSGHETTTVEQTTPSEPSTNEFTVNVSFPATYASPLQFFASLFSDLTLRVSVTMQQEDSA